MNFEEIMAPLGADTFLRDYLGQRPVHIQGTPDKFHDVMNWDVLNRLLGATSIWTHQTLALVMDKEPIPPASYTASAPGRNGGTELRPDPVRVQQHIARGATLVLNFIDHLTPELQAFADAIEEALGGELPAVGVALVELDELLPQVAVVVEGGSDAEELVPVLHFVGLHGAAGVGLRRDRFLGLVRLDRCVLLASQRLYLCNAFSEVACCFYSI